MRLIKLALVGAIGYGLYRIATRSSGLPHTSAADWTVGGLADAGLKLTDAPVVPVHHPGSGAAWVPVMPFR